MFFSVRILTMQRTVHACILASTIALTGCSFIKWPSFLGGATTEASPDEFAPEAPASATTGDQAPTYTIHANDELDIIIWQHPELSASVPVRPDGRISAPLVEDLPAVGKTPTQLARQIEHELSRYLKQAVASVIVKRFQTTEHEKIRIVGEVNQPTSISYRKGMTILDAVIAASGINKNASGNSTIIWRARTRNEEVIPLQDLLKGKAISANVSLQPGDIVIVPKSFF